MSLAATAERLIAKHGRDVTVLFSGNEPEDEAKPWRGPSSTFVTAEDEDAVATVGAFLDYTEREIDGMDVRRGDKRVFVAGSAGDLAAARAISDAGSVWRIVRMGILEPGATRLLYDFQVRQ